MILEDLGTGAVTCGSVGLIHAHSLGIAYIEVSIGSLQVCTVCSS